MAPRAAKKPVTPNDWQTVDPNDWQTVGPNDWQTVNAAPVQDSTNPTTGDKAVIGPTQPEPWLNQVEDDLTYGGNRTFLGRVLGRMEGRGSKGYAGMGQGPEGVDSVPASVFMGPLHALEGGREVVTGHPLKGAWDTLKGGFQAAQMPLMVMAAPEAESAMDSIPSAKNAGRLLDEVMNGRPAEAPEAGQRFYSLMGGSKSNPEIEAATRLKQMEPADGTEGAKNVAVRMERTRPALERFEELTQRGGKRSKPFTQLYKRMQSEGDIPYAEGRDFYTNIGDAAYQSPLQKLMGRGMKPTMRMAAVNVRRALNGDLADAAASVGQGENYANGMNEYKNAMRLKKYVRAGALVGAEEAARRSGMLGKLMHRTALTQH